MSTKVGLWIDHRKAIVIAMTEQGEKIEEIVSGVEKQLQRAGDRPLEGNYESVQVPADDRRQRDLTKHLNFTMLRSLQLFRMLSLFSSLGQVKQRAN